MHVAKSFARLIAAGLCAAALIPAAWAQDPPAAASSEESAYAGGDAGRGKQIFASNGCGWCHEGSGRKSGRGPPLMNTTRDDDFLANRIATGVPGRMPAFGQGFAFDQIKDLIAFIRSIKPEGPS